MKVNNRLFLGILSTASLLVLVGYFVVFTTWIDEPIFFQHEYDQVVYKNSDDEFETRFKLRYMTNALDDRVINRIEFAELTAGTSGFDEAESEYSDWINTFEDIRTCGQYGQYDVKEFVVNIKDTVDLNNKVFTQARITYDDLSEQIVDIGEIRFWEQSTDSEFLQSTMKSSTADGSTESVYSAQKDVEITQIDRGPLNEYTDVLSMKINGAPIEHAEGMKLEKEELMGVTSEIKRNKNILNEYTLYELNLQMTAVDQDGKIYSQRLTDLQDRSRDYSFWKLYDYNKARGKGK